MYYLVSGVSVYDIADPLTEMITDRNKLQFVTTIQWLWLCGALVWMTDASMATMATISTTQTSVHRQPKQFQMLSQQQAATANDSPPASQEAATGRFL